jgi:hypothetical protein
MQSSSNLASKAILQFTDKLKQLTSYEQIGLAMACSLTPNSGPIRKNLSGLLPKFQLADAFFRSWLPIILVLEAALILIAIIAGPLSGILGGIVVGAVAATSIIIVLLVPSILFAAGIIVTAYRTPSVYESIRVATRHRSLYLGRLQHSARLLSGLPGNVDRGLDGFRILGAMSDLISIASLNPQDLSPQISAIKNIAITQDEQVKKIPSYLSIAYGAIAESMWGEDRIVSSLLSLKRPLLRPGVFRSDSGSILYELFIHAHSPVYEMVAVTITTLLISVPIAIIMASLTFFFLFFLLISGFIRTRTIEPGTHHYAILSKSLSPLINASKNISHSGNLSVDLSRAATAVGASLSGSQPILRSDLIDLADLITQQVKGKENARYVSQMLFFPYWCSQAIPSDDDTNAPIDIGKRPESTLSKEVFRFQGALSESLSEILNIKPTPNNLPNQPFEKASGVNVLSPTVTNKDMDDSQTDVTTAKNPGEDIAQVDDTQGTPDDTDINKEYGDTKDPSDPDASLEELGIDENEDEEPPKPPGEEDYSDEWNVDGESDSEEYYEDTSSDDDYDDNTYDDDIEKLLGEEDDEENER